MAAESEAAASVSTPSWRKRTEPKMTRRAPASSRVSGLSRRAHAATHLDRQTAGDLLDQRAVISHALRGVQVDELHERIAGEALDPGLEIVESEPELLAALQLDDAAAHQVDGRNQHGSLTGMPSRRSSSFSERTSAMPK